jgi:hypothetical protein
MSAAEALPVTSDTTVFEEPTNAPIVISVIPNETGWLTEPHEQHIPWGSNTVIVWQLQGDLQFDGPGVQFEAGAPFTVSLIDTKNCVASANNNDLQLTQTYSYTLFVDGKTEDPTVENDPPGGSANMTLPERHGRR